MIDRAVASFGRLDMAFNNAGIQVPPSDAADEPAENFDRVNAINLRGVWTCMKHELRQMREQGSGAIVQAWRDRPYPRAQRSNMRRGAFASTPCAQEQSIHRW